MSRAFAAVLAAAVAIWYPGPSAGENVSRGTLEIKNAIDQAASIIACGAGAVWAVYDGRLLRIDPADGTMLEAVVPTNDLATELVDFDRFRGMAVGEGAVWLPDTATSMIHKFDLVTAEHVLSISTDIFGAKIGNIAVGEGAVWVITFETRNKTLARYNSANGAEEARIALPRASEGIAVGHGSIWVTAAQVAELYRVDPRANEVVQTIGLAGITHLVAASDEAIWVSLGFDGLLQKINGRTGEISATIATNVVDSSSDGSIVVGGGSVWAMTRFSTVVEIDPEKSSILGVYAPEPGTIMGRRSCYGDDALWISGSSIFRVEPQR